MNKDEQALEKIGKAEVAIGNSYVPVSETKEFEVLEETVKNHNRIKRANDWFKCKLNDKQLAESIFNIFKGEYQKVD